MVRNGSLVVARMQKLMLDISDFSSVLMGVVPNKTLYTFGRAAISDTAYIHTVTDLFHAHRKPSA
ncbi:hypothetical protein L1611_13940 [Alkalihalobacillus sp. EGI L200015]|nr:hypothetical protein [Pseudalkalibacillus salsuginis]